MLIDLTKKKLFTIEHKGLRVFIEPLDKLEDDRLEEKYTQGRLEITTQNKKGFRGRGDSTMRLPEVSRTALNLERAQRTWKKWETVNPEDEMPPCTPENIALMFQNHYDEWAGPILEKFQERLDDEGDDDDKEVTAKNS